MSDPITKIQETGSTLIIEELMYAIRKMNTAIRCMVHALRPESNHKMRALAYSFACTELNRLDPSIDHLESLLKVNGLLSLAFDADDLDSEQDELDGVDNQEDENTTMEEDVPPPVYTPKPCIEHQPDQLKELLDSWEK